MPKIYFIIVTYNAMKWAEKCFVSLRKSSVPVHCIVVDNCSTDGTQEYIKNNFPEVDFIQSEENLGFGKANNVGIEKAYKEGGDFFYLMNQDAWIYPDSLEKLLEVYNNYPNKTEIGIISPMHLDGTEKKLDIFLDKYISYNCDKTRLISDLYFQTLKPYYELDFINAAHWLLPKETIDIVGGFNPYFFHYGEDNEYVNRLQYHKKKTIIVPGSKVVHDGKQLLDKVDYKKYKNLSTETKIINPNLRDSLRSEKKALLQSMIKNFILGNFKTSQQLFKKYRNISAEAHIFNEIRAKVTKQGTTFLKI
ncbi:N-acetylglucosaminyl-diphospho-decaprenol L-rhamnosyltransferase [Chryseobacterium ginsenosidimutans]|uniref:glycosyltransferase family 2 protein n=1 Tax=Chryseobacterium ginsenosidimutans TaxID=687846 RepID=UPI00277D673D|nr:glycosyltransferase family 2 protein [Chryseobacterium ginsenosidimutans]MDQ0591906.1 N-acetylglucosaminyl-diphospho-decaprenol L-rhamnosyltransferase [Chryseobacterium ginsenosidimutans]